jgi:predicted DNA-binding transcriptional regulator YafY
MIIKKEKYRIIDVEQIEGKIEVLTDQINDLYETREYIDIYRESFSLSSEPISHVVVEVKDYGNLKRKFQTLCDQRNKMFRGEERAKITESPKTFDDQKESGEQNTFLYEDNLRGLSDFAKYLRRFGRSVRVIEPEKLRRLMLDDVTRLEEVYRKEGLYE